MHGRRPRVKISKYAANYVHIMTAIGRFFTSGRVCQSQRRPRRPGYCAWHRRPGRQGLACCQAAKFKASWLGDPTNRPRAAENYLVPLLDTGCSIESAAAHAQSDTQACQHRPDGGRLDCESV